MYHKYCDSFSIYDIHIVAKNIAMYRYTGVSLPAYISEHLSFANFQSEGTKLCQGRSQALVSFYNKYTDNVLSSCLFVFLYFFLCSLMNEVVHTSPTIGSNVEEVVWKNIHFLMWDIGGQESLRAAWNTYYTNTGVRTF